MAEEEIMIMEKEMLTTRLPQEIIIEILSWLPAKSLLSSFKFVCKVWRTLIQDPDFINMHLINRGGAIHGDRGERRISYNNHSLICKSGNTLFQFHPPFNFEGIPPILATRLDFDFDFDFSSSPSSRLVGSCNGLLCLNVIQDESIILLNPSTKKFKLPPKQPIECPSHLTFRKPATYGFGCYYNSIIKIGEYKVVRIAYIYPSNENDHSFRIQIDVYSMSSNSWRRKRDVNVIPYLIAERLAIFVSGALHWIGCCVPGCGYDTDVLISFDIRNEDFGHIAMPPRDENVNIMGNAILMNLRGCLCIIYVENMGADLEIWVMKEYGIREPWTRECVIRSSNSDPSKAVSEMSFNASVCFLKGDQILINRGYGRRALYDMNTKKLDGDFKLVGVPNEFIIDLVDYVETLVSLKSSLQQ